MSRMPDEIRCPVTMRLGPSRIAERAECWIFERRALEELDDFVHAHQDTLLERLEFALIHQRGSSRVILRSYPSQSGPPTLPFQTGRYAPLFRLPNVCVPCDARLIPLLRRDFLREWLVRKDQFTWLEPDGPREFHVHRVPLVGFRPLTEWVTYAPPQPNPRQPVVLAASLFRPEPFAVREEPKPEVKKEKTVRQDTSVYLEPPKNLPVVVKGVAPPKAVVLPTLEIPPEAEIPTPEEVIVKLRLLEKRFRNSTLPLDANYRQEWWAGLARQNRLALLDEEADRCWSFAVWEEDGETIWMSGWTDNHPTTRKQTLAAIGRKKEPTTADLRTLAVALIHEASHRQPKFPLEVIPAAQRTLEEHDNRMPVRLAWLAWNALAKLAGNDVLALTRARDRLLRDLMEYGLRKDRDFPLFLQTKAGRSGPGSDSDDTALFLRVRERARDWCLGKGSERLSSPHRLWVDLTFAVALARFGEMELARSILDDSSKRWQKSASKSATPSQSWLFEAYQERVHQACRGENPNTPLPAALRQSLTTLTGEQRITAERYLRDLRILEPLERVDPYRNSRPVEDDLQKKLNAIQSLAPAPASRKRRAESHAEELDARYRELFRGQWSPRQMLRILAAAAPTATRLGESFALECHRLLEKTLPQATHLMDVLEIASRVGLIETMAVTLAHFGRTNLIGGLLEEWRKTIRAQKGELGALFARATGGGSFRFMARVGLQEQAKELLAETAESFMNGKSVKKVMARPALNRGVFVPAFARLAAGWFYFNETDLAKEAIRVVREEMLTNTVMLPENRAALAASYAFALGMAPRAFAIAHYEEMFASLKINVLDLEGKMIRHLMVIEAVVTSLSADDFSSDEQTRRWMDEDEFLVRRRIHRDVETARKLAGL